MKIVRRCGLLAFGVLCIVADVLLRVLAPQSYFTWSFVKDPPTPFWIEVQWISEQWLLYIGIVLVALWVGYWFAVWRAIRRLRHHRASQP